MRNEDLLRIAQLRESCSSGEVRAWRVRSRLSQAELAQLLGVSSPAVSRWETGQRTPRGAVALKLASIMDTFPARRSRR